LGQLFQDGVYRVTISRWVFGATISRWYLEQLVQDEYLGQLFQDGYLGQLFQDLYLIWGNCIKRGIQVFGFLNSNYTLPFKTTSL